MKRARIIGEPRGGDGESASAAGLFAPSHMASTPADDDTMIDDAGTAAGPAGLPGDGGDSAPREPEGKRLRVAGVNAVVGGVIGRVRAIARQYGFGEVDKLATCQRARESLSQLGQSYNNTLRRRTRRVVWATGRRLQMARGPSTRIGEAYCQTSYGSQS